MSAAHAAERGSDDSRSELELVASGPLAYALSLPSDHRGSSTSWPVICFLHGYDEAAPTPLREGITRHGPLRPGNPASVRDRFIIVAPQLPRGGDVWHAYEAQVMEIVDAIRREHGGDPSRSYLTGFSFGGNGVFDLGRAHRGEWAALWAVDPTRVPREDPGPPVWLSVGEVARRNAEAFTRALALEQADRAADERGDPPSDRIVLDEGGDHVGSARSAYSDERIYRWLLARSLD